MSLRNVCPSQVVLREPEESYDAASAGKLLGGCAEGDLEAVVKALLKDRWVVRVKSGYKTRRSYALSHLAKRVVFPFRHAAQDSRTLTQNSPPRVIDVTLSPLHLHLAVSRSRSYIRSSSLFLFALTPC